MNAEIDELKTLWAQLRPRHSRRTCLNRALLLESRLRSAAGRCGRSRTRSWLESSLA